MKQTKQVIAVLLSILMLVSIFPSAGIIAYAENTAPQGTANESVSEPPVRETTSDVYAIAYQSNDAGTITGPKTAKPGDTVTVTQTPDEGYSLFSLTARDAAGDEVAVTDNQFIMPASDVRLKAVFVTDTMPNSGIPEEYNVRARVAETYFNDSGDSPENYNSISAEVYTYKGDSYYAPNDKEEFQLESSHDIKYDISEIDAKWTYYYTSKDFPGNIRLHVDLGGGFTWYEYGYYATYKIGEFEPFGPDPFNYEHAKSYPFSRAVKTYNFLARDCGSDVLPYIYRSFFYTREENSSEISSNLKLDMYVDPEHPENPAKGYLYINSMNQYFVKWDSWDNPYVSLNVTSTTHPDTDKITYIGSKNGTGIWEITTTAKQDHTSHLKLTFENAKVETPDYVRYNEADVQLKIIEPSYTLTYNDVAHGSVSGPTTAEYGDEITLAPTPDNGYTFSRYVVTDSNGNNIRVTNNTFTMPNSNVTISTYFSNVQHVGYLSETGEVKYADAVALDGGETELSAGWYVANGNV